MLIYIIFISFFVITFAVVWGAAKINLLIRHGKISLISSALLIAWRRNNVKHKCNIHIELRLLVETAVELQIIHEKVFLDVAKNAEIRIGKDLNPNSQNNTVAQAALLTRLYYLLGIHRKHLVIIDSEDVKTWLEGGPLDHYCKSIASWIFHELTHRYLEEKYGDSDHDHKRIIWKQLKNK